MILAAGRGERMRPLTDRIPKPLLAVAGKALIEFHVEALVDAGIRDIVVNLSHLGETVEQALGDGRRYGAHLSYSWERPKALETGGGIFNALPLLGGQPFVVVNGDIWTDYPFVSLPQDPPALAHLVLVSNPAHHPEGDFGLQRDGQIVDDGGAARLTYSGIGVYRPEMFSACRAGAFALAPLLRHAISQGHVSGEHYTGRWYDIGTPQRLEQLQRVLDPGARLDA